MDIEKSWTRTLKLQAPTLSLNIGDADRLGAELRRRFSVEHIRIDLALLRRLPKLLREWDYSLRCACFPNGDALELVGIAPGPDAADVAPAPLLGAAVDLGTTRIVLRLVDLETQDILAERGFDNPQIALAPDVLARIHHCAKKGGLEELQQLVVQGLNEQIEAQCEELGLPVESLCIMTISGNTAMSHLFLGLEPRWIIREPYIPAANTFQPQRASDLGLQAGPAARVFIFPNIGSYFGGDLISGILYSGLHEREEPAIMVDVGTNAEVVLGNQDWLLACAGAAGPALEGGAASMGMMAEPGVIDRVTLDATSGELEIHTIDDEPPRGICGSGLIDLAASLFKAGIIDIRGELVPKRCGEHLTDLDGVAAYVVVDAAHSATGQPLTLSQVELDSLIRSKAAMFSILETISASVGLTPSDFQTFLVAGTFGSFIDPESAITLGMLPDIGLESFQRLGNSSLGGATLLLTTPEKYHQVTTIRDAITYLELNVNQDFMLRFSAAKFIPHTDSKRFPSVSIPPQK